MMPHIAIFLLTVATCLPLSGCLHGAEVRTVVAELAALKSSTTKIVRYLDGLKADPALGGHVLAILTSSDVSDTAKGIAVDYLKVAADRGSLPYVDVLASPHVAIDFKGDLIGAIPTEVWQKEDNLTELLTVAERNAELRLYMAEVVSRIPDRPRWLGAAAQGRLAKALTIWCLDALAQDDALIAGNLALAMARMEMTCWPELALRALRRERAARVKSKNTESYIVAPALLGKLSERLAAHGYRNQAEALIGDDLLTEAEMQKFEQWWDAAKKPAWVYVDKALDSGEGGR